MKRNKLKNEERLTSVLFEECLAVLGSDVIVMTDERSKEIYKLFEAEFKINLYGRIEWDSYKAYEEMDENTFGNRYMNQEEYYYILWSHGSDPVIKARLNQIVKNLEDVTAVSPDIWVYREERQVIELFHDGIVRVMQKKERLYTLMIEGGKNEDHKR
ncbi:hypothetical protein [Paenibacillus polysaccharolyticus]|uniref:CDI toxin immunity protein n=1 Tax=Paenibacillus polysaccharolyticus TaxID=582692 RepID=UPI0011139411|nr:hypothetical protein [Paenibacillus polysaccharolyticus]